jgi:hypothetical protein
MILMGNLLPRKPALLELTRYPVMLFGGQIVIINVQTWPETGTGYGTTSARVRVIILM